MVLTRATLFAATARVLDEANFALCLEHRPHTLLRRKWVIAIGRINCTGAAVVVLWATSAPAKAIHAHGSQAKALCECYRDSHGHEASGRTNTCQAQLRTVQQAHPRSINRQRREPSRRRVLLVSGPEQELTVQRHTVRARVGETQVVEHTNTCARANVSCVSSSWSAIRTYYYGVRVDRLAMACGQEVAAGGNNGQGGRASLRPLVLENVPQKDRKFIG